MKYRLSARFRQISKVLVAGTAVLAVAATSQAQLPGSSAQGSTGQDKIVASAATTCGAAGKFAPRCGALWGAYTLQNGSPEQSVTRLESQVGRKFDLTLRYHDFSDSLNQGQFPDVHERKLGQILSVMGTFLPREIVQELETLQDESPRPTATAPGVRSPAAATAAT